MTTPVIKKTSDYTIFKSVSFNREKNKKHIDTVKKIIERENLLHLHPILVNKNMEVIDGQHRLEAAKELGLEVFYIQSDISYDHILHSNLYQKNMLLDDVIRFYALKDKIPDYIKFRDYQMLLEIGPKSLISLIFGNSSKSIVEFFKAGRFKLPEDDKKLQMIIDSYADFIAYAKEKRITPIAMLKSNYFTVAYRILILCNGFASSVFYTKLDQRWYEIKPQPNIKEWTKLLLSIYNWKNQNPLNDMSNEEKN